MTQPISLVVFANGLDNFKEIRTALASDSRARLLAGGTDAEQLYDEVVRLKPSAAIIALGANAELTIKLIAKMTAERPATAIICAAQNASGDLILQSLRSGAREFLNLPIRAEELSTVLDRVAEFSEGQ